MSSVDPRSSPTDAELVTAVADGDQRALTAIMDRHGRSIVQVATRICGPMHAPDVLQEVSLRLWTHPDRFDAGRGSLRTFLLTMTKGRAIDLVRSEAKRREREHRVEADRAQPLATGAPPEDAHVWTVLAQLAPDQCQAIFLAFHQGHTYQHVAQILGVPEGTVKGRIRSGLVELRHLLEPV